MKILKELRYDKDGSHYNVITFTFPERLPRHNPYMDDEQQYLLGTYPAFTGLIVRHRKDGSHYDELGFAGTIDMDYKGKDDQVSDFIVKWEGEEEEFLKICKELVISVHELVL